MSWEDTTLGELLTVKHGWAFKSQYFEEDGPYVLVTPGNFFEKGGFKLRPGKDRSYSGQFAPEYLLGEGDLIVAMTEQGPGLLGSTALIPAADRFLHNQRIGLITMKDEQHTCRNFLYYLFNTAPVRGQINGSATGTKVRHTAPERIYRVRVPVPDLRTQERIAAILSAYDGLIENNRRRISLLEQAAQLLYREWFVHFQFPDHKDVKFDDGLPKGWTQQPLSEIAEITMGQSPKSEFYNEKGDGLPFHQGVTNYGFRFVEDRIFSTAITKLANAGDILFSVRAPVGRINYTLNQIVLGRGLSAFRSMTGHQSFLFYCLKSHFFKEDLIGGGAIYAATNKKELETIEVVLPPNDLIAAYDSKASSIDAQIKVLSLKNRQLTKARDLLLPRLMDGRIPV